MAILGDIFGAGGVAALAGKAVDALTAWIPNPTERAKAALEVQKVMAEHEFELAKREMDLLQGQQDINKVEAASPQWFVAGWRPFIGWLCGVILAVMYLPKCLVLTIFWSIQAWNTVSGSQIVIPHLPDFPNLGTGDIMGLLTAMLGIGGMRTWEKIKGVDTKAVKK